MVIALQNRPPRVELEGATGRVQSATVLALARADIADGAARLLAEGYSLYLASHHRVLERLEPAPFGLPVSALDLLAPHDAPWAIADLMRVYNVLNATAFGPKGIPLQNWVMIDLGLLPSAFLLITLSPERARATLTDPRLDDAGRARVEAVLPAVLAEADRLRYTGPIPVAGYCAAPTPAPGEWVGWSLCSAIPGLGTITKGLALEVYRAHGLTGVVQFWDGSGVHVHRRFGRMEILSAVLDLHPVSNTFVYRTELYAEDDAEPTLMLGCRDIAAQREIQSRIDSGAGRFFVLSPGLVDGQVPILERH
jgi:hypothetical protein